MKQFIGEIIDPLVHFYKMRKSSEIAICIIIPIICGTICAALSFFIIPNYSFDFLEFSNDIINQFITILTLFISFSMAYLSIIVASESENIKRLKETDSSSYQLNNETCTLYQVLVSEITYSIIIQIFFLLLTVLQKFIINFINSNFIRVLISIDVALFVHVLILMLVIVKNIYYSFWKSE